MSVLPGSREKVLNRIRAATHTGAQKDRTEAYAAIPRAYVHAGELSAAECVALMIKRLQGYDANVVETTADQLSKVIAEQIAASGRHSFVVPAGVPPAWLAAGYEWKIDKSLSAAELEQTEGVLTGAFCGIADSGTIVLHHSSTEGRRILTLLPDWHLCVLYASQVVQTLPEYFARCEQAPGIATFISGPSATADIEMTRIKGVHGPRFLNVVVVH
jgi:L-lactate dehydrogenase complex protein LldG